MKLASRDRDNGPPERWQHDRPRVRAMKIGSGRATEDVISVEHPTQIDKLYETGMLGGGKRAVSRYEAGLWLMRCRGAAGLEPRLTASYGPPGGHEEITDAQAWSRRMFNDAVRGMGASSRAILNLIDDRSDPAALDEIKDGLDRLAKMRGY